MNVNINFSQVSKDLRINFFFRFKLCCIGEEKMKKAVNILIVIDNLVKLNSPFFVCCQRRFLFCGSR